MSPSLEAVAEQDAMPCDLSSTEECLGHKGEESLFSIASSKAKQVIFSVHSIASAAGYINTQSAINYIWEMGCGSNLWRLVGVPLVIESWSHRTIKVGKDL